MGEMRGFIAIECCNCGVIFGLGPKYQERRRADKARFFCPNGHGQSYQESPEDALRRERDRLKQQMAEKDDAIQREREAREAAERRASAARGQVTRLRKRAAAGVCPCCNRTFSQLAAHMTKKHPGFAAVEVSHD